MAAGPGVRVDTAIEAGEIVPPDYDPLIAKLLVHAGNRDGAIERLCRALDETEVGGVQTTLPFHRFVARSAAFRAADLSTDFVDDRWNGPAEREGPLRRALLAAGLAAFTSGSAGEPLPAAPPGAARLDVDSDWLVSGRLAAVDRWPG
jgi:acetyl/propionyl-CoA carboxylase alpha subunit